MATVRLQELDPLYNLDGKPVCPRCYSRPDSLNPEGNIKITGESVITSNAPKTIIYKTYHCSRPGCYTLLRVRGLLVSTPDDFVPPWLEEFIMTLEQAEEYEQGYHDKKGTWHGPEEDGTESLPEEEETEEGRGREEEAQEEVKSVHVEQDRMWVLIDPGPYEDEIPDLWTRNEQGRIKARHGTDRYKKIVKFFKQRGVDLP